MHGLVQKARFCLRLMHDSWLIGRHVGVPATVDRRS